VIPDAAGDGRGWGPVADRVILHPAVGLLRDAYSSLFQFPLSVRLRYVVFSLPEYLLFLWLCFLA
jgi:hypothetical protein